MIYRDIYLVVRVDVECPDDYEATDLEIAEDFQLQGITLDEDHECKVNDYEICGLSE